MTDLNSKTHIIETLDLIKYKGLNLTKGPMDHMIKWCQPDAMYYHKIQQENNVGDFMLECLNNPS